MDFLELGMEIVAVKGGKNGTMSSGEIVGFPSDDRNKVTIKVNRRKVNVDKDDIVEVDGHERKRPTYYQPRLNDEEFEKHDLTSSDVYREFDNAREEFPNTIIDKFVGSEIENHTFVDDENHETPTYYVDVPKLSDFQEFINIYSTHHRPDALLFARLFLHADENGMISLISQS
jgi:hypothetical protein